jgi:hypothetical protein
VRNAAALNRRLASLTVKGKWHREKGLESVAMRAACGRDIGFSG